MQTKLMLQNKKVVAGDLKKMKNFQNKLKMSGDLNWMIQNKTIKNGVQNKMKIHGVQNKMFRILNQTIGELN